MKELGNADWTKRDDLPALVDALGAQDMRWVGGAVRDGLLGHDVADVDVATTLHPQDVMQRLKDGGIKPIPTGIDHGTVTAVMPHGNVEVTTLRRDVATDGRRATIAFATDWQEDASRRDFTINALFAHPETLEISDYFGGMEDLEQRRVRFIGDAHQRIREDHLRILRYYRFQSRFGCNLDEEAETACQELAPTMKGLSRERVAGETLALLRIADPTSTITRMWAKGVLSVVLPETGEDEIMRLEQVVQAEFDAALPPDPVRRLAALLPQDGEVAEKAAARLRLSNAVRKRIGLAARPLDAAPPRLLAHTIGREAAMDRLLIAGEDVSQLQDWQVPRFPLAGGEIVRRGVAAGPEVSRILQAVEKRWAAEGFPDRYRVDALLDDELSRFPD